MNLLVIGDVHGCFNTLRALFKSHWNEKESIVVITGDIIHKGLHSGKTLKYLRKLSNKFPKSIVVVKGNHEQMVFNAHFKGEVYPNWKKLKRDILKQGLNIKKTIKWICDLPVIWENNSLIITHAGIALDDDNNFNLDSKSSILNNRLELKNCSKLQIFGHVIQDFNQPRFFPNSNSWGIDTGCWQGGGLTAIKLELNGKIIEIIRQPTIQSDL